MDAEKSRGIDRNDTVPFLLRLFFRTGSSHGPHEFLSLTNLPPHITIYTWTNCTLRELAYHLVEAKPAAFPSPSIGTRLVFRLVYPDAKAIANANAPANFIIRDLGSVVLGSEYSGTKYHEMLDERAVNDKSCGSTEMNNQDVLIKNEVEARLGRGQPDGGGLGSTTEDESNVMLQDTKFVIGDYVSVSILPPGIDGEVAEAPAFRGPILKMESRLSNGIDVDFSGFGEKSLGSRRRRRGGRNRGGNTFSGTNTIPLGEWRRGERIPDPPKSVGGRRRKRW